MAAVAGIEIGSRRKLSCMPVGMAIGTVLELDLEQRLSALRNMALRTLQPRVSALQRVGGQGVFLPREQRRFPALYVVARRTLAAVSSLGELAVVRIFMAIRALGEWNRLLEISAGMALRAIDCNVLPFQREFRLRVIEMRAHRLQRNLLPSAGAVAGGASLREAATVRILVAIRTLIEWNARVLRLSIRSIRMTLRALHLRVHASKRIARLRVIELAHVHRFPILEVVAGLAIRSEASLVLILVASQAGRRKAQECPVQIFDLDRRAFLRRNVRRSVALIAGESSVLAFQQISRVFVVEGLRVPFNKRKIFAVVLGVATRTLLA